MEIDPGPDQALADLLRRVLGARPAPEDPTEDPDGDATSLARVDAALQALELLLDLGWVAPDRLDDALRASSPEPGTVGVRSLAEDLAVVRAQARATGERSRAQIARTRAVIARSEALLEDASRRLADARRRSGSHAPSGARDTRGTEERHRARACGGVEGGPALQEEVVQLRSALANRPRIEHAVGVVMGALGCDAATAFSALGELSQHTNVKLRDLSEALTDRVARGEGVSPDVLAALRVFVTARVRGAARRPR